MKTLGILIVNKNYSAFIREELMPFEMGTQQVEVFVNEDGILILPATISCALCDRIATNTFKGRGVCDLCINQIKKQRSWV